MPDLSAQLDQLVDAVRKSAGYRSVCEDLIRNIGARELAKRLIDFIRCRLVEFRGLYIADHADDLALDLGAGAAEQNFAKRGLAGEKALRAVAIALS